MRDSYFPSYLNSSPERLGVSSSATKHINLAHEARMSSPRDLVQVLFEGLMEVLLERSNTSPEKLVASSAKFNII